MKPLQHPSPEAFRLANVLHALADPLRVAMLRRLAGCCDGLACGAVCDAQPRSTLSFNLKVLREAGLVRSARRGKEIVNVIRRDEVDARFPGLLDAVFRAHAAECAVPELKDSEARRSA